VRPALPPGPFLVVGLARSGKAAARLLLDRGEQVLAADSGHPEVDFPAALGSDGLALLAQAGCVVKSPGVPVEAPVIAAAHASGVPVIGELELAWRLLPNPFVAVTGTNGKTTTTELLGAIWPGAVTAGNVGTPLSSLVGKVEPAAWIICECSSFQLEDSVAFHPQIAVLLNLEEDHLDRHGTMEAYRAAKLRIFANQTTSDLAVVPRGFEFGGAARRIDYDDVVLPDGLRLRGEHNRQNARAAKAAALVVVPEDVIDAGLQSFAGVPHRLEEVADRDGVQYVKD
jgi:UDP-N-acetylmuramoylalanine--D-glutamate ligase